MHPLLLKIGSIPIHTYGFMIAIGFLIAIWVVRSLAERAKINVERTLDLSFWCLLLGFLGARSLFISTRLPTFLQDPASMFRVWEGGLVFLGGPLVVVPFAIWYTRRHGLSPWKVVDVLMPALTVAHAFGRFGCLAAGCCYGRPTGSEWGIRFHSDLVEKHLHGIPLHPTQLYEAGALLILFFGLLRVFKRKEFDGQVGLTYFIAYPIIRSIVEIYRGDEIRGFVIDGILSTSQFISLLIFVAAAITLRIRLKQVNARPAGAKA
jgi:phosphatidylglycerol:prolipoprotein diacylglycerol transferase